MRPIKLIIIAYFVALSCFVITNRCEAHDAFYPHHLKDVKAATKRGKILVITLVVSAGLVVLISTAVLRGGKEEEAGSTENVAPAELRASVIAAVVAGQRGVEEGREKALNMALSAYARTRGIEWRNEELEHIPFDAYTIGKDRVIVTISDDGTVIEASTMCGKMGASATVSAKDNSVYSSIFSSHSMDREEGKG